ncbi:tail protein X [Rivihabitans pingtungensis]|uniref:tail protein X n=1 Tax=Rivihabitans pingtungensis TaxID=1054498 RepID=UPI00235200F6|nr:tail protein X [Rivihabitans pingtungensis]MCK6435958.1 tail protein X [Rivihabitans pingtungensis]
MAKTIRTSDGDRLDTLCHRYYGRLNGVAEAVLAANPGLAAKPQPFRAGLIIHLPDLPVVVEKPVQLWS